MSLTQLRLGAGALAVAGALLIAAPTSGAGATVATAKKGASITISNFMFTPMSIKVKPGTKIKVTNKDSVTHTLSAQGKGTFNTGNIGHNQSKTITAPSKAGTYHYICNIHQYMMGTITVT